MLLQTCPLATQSYSILKYNMRLEMITIDYGGGGLEDDDVINIPEFLKKICHFYSEFDPFRIYIVLDLMRQLYIRKSISVHSMKE